MRGHRRFLRADGPFYYRPMLSGAILVGGQSRRMGRDKSRLMLEGETLVARATRTLRVLCDDLVVVASAPEQYPDLDARSISDIFPGGALAGVHAGLMAARHESVVVVACDMPFLNAPLLQYMAQVAGGYDAVIPRWQGEFEPLHAIYSRRCIAVIEPFLQQGGRRIVEIYERINARYVERQEIARFDPEGLSFFNINSPEDWARAQALARAAREG